MESDSEELVPDPTGDEPETAEVVLVPDTTDNEPDSSSDDESTIKSVCSLSSYPCCCECSGQPCECSCTESMKIRGGYIKIDDIKGESELLKKEKAKDLRKKESAKVECYRKKQEDKAKRGQGGSQGYHKGTSHSHRNLCDGDDCDGGVTAEASVDEGFTEEANVGVDVSKAEGETEDETKDKTTEGEDNTEDETKEGEEETAEDNATGTTLPPVPCGDDSESRESVPSEEIKPEPFLMCCCECYKFPCDCACESS